MGIITKHNPIESKEDKLKKEYKQFYKQDGWFFLAFVITLLGVACFIFWAIGGFDK